jgi:hypothetical protein
LTTLKGDPGKVFIDTLMTMIAYAFLQHRRLAQAGAEKKSTDLRLNQACRPCAKPSSISFFDRHLNDAHTAEDGSVKSYSK